MYTFCPECSRQYRIRAAQLQAAQGLVICGFCGKRFNAMDRLYDRPQKPPLRIDTVNIPGPDVVPDEGAPPSPEFIGGTMQGGRAGRPTVVAKKEPRLDLSEALLDKEPVSGGKARSNAWSAGALVMLLLLAFQVAWFNRDDVLQAYPQLTPWVESFCARYQCDLTGVRDYSAIKLLNRDVRLHPNYADTLLVNATMANQSSRTLPFPKIQLALFDINGQMLAYRDFTAQEYLDHSIDIKKGMTPGQPVHFVLEITGPTQDAVSFEFRFL